MAGKHVLVAGKQIVQVAFRVIWEGGIMMPAMPNGV